MINASAMPYLRPSLAICVMIRNGLSEAEPLVRRNVAMRLFADQQQRRQLVPLAPNAEVEKNAAQRRDDNVGDLRWNAGEVDDRERLVVNRNSQQAADNLPKMSSSEENKNSNRRSWRSNSMRAFSADRVSSYRAL